MSHTSKQASKMRQVDCKWRDAGPLERRESLKLSRNQLIDSLHFTLLCWLLLTHSNYFYTFILFVCFCVCVYAAHWDKNIVSARWQYIIQVVQIDLRFFNCWLVKKKKRKFFFFPTREQQVAATWFLSYLIGELFRVCVCRRRSTRTNKVVELLSCGHTRAHRCRPKLFRFSFFLRNWPPPSGSIARTLRVEGNFTRSR